jgi:hypothetical protein
MFTCDSGDCIAANELCDGIAQCQDQSDESNCAILHVPQTYNSRSPPQNEAPLIINFTIEILQVPEIDDDHHWLQLDLVVTLTWKDGRLKFMNLHQDSDNNFLSDDEVAQIWTPKFEFSSVQDGDTTLIDKQVQIVADGKALSTDYNRQREGDGELNIGRSKLWLRNRNYCTISHFRLLHKYAYMVFKY